MSLESLQKQKRRQKLEEEISAHLREAEKRLRLCFTTPSGTGYLPSTAAYCVLNTAKGMYQYTKASAPSAINRLATAVEDRVGILAAPVAQFGPTLLNTLDDTFLVCQEKLLPYVRTVSDLGEAQ